MKIVDSSKIFDFAIALINKDDMIEKNGLIGADTPTSPDQTTK